MNVDPEELKPSLNIIKTLNSPSNVWSYMKFKKMILFLILQLNHHQRFHHFIFSPDLSSRLCSDPVTDVTNGWNHNFQTPGSKTWHEASALHRNIGGLLSWKRHYLHPKENTKYFRRDCCWIKLDPDPHVLLLVVAKLFVFFFCFSFTILSTQDESNLFPNWKQWERIHIYPGNRVQLGSLSQK